MSDSPLAKNLHEELIKSALTNRYAKQRLLDGVSECVNAEWRQRPNRLCLLIQCAAQPGTLQATVSGMTLLICTATGPAGRDERHALLGGVLLAAALQNAWVDAREQRIAQSELASRISAWVKEASRDHKIFRSDTSRATRAISVMRDSVWLRLQPNLLVAGDLIMLRPGDVAPADCAQPPSLSGGASPRRLAAGEPFLPRGAPSASGDYSDGFFLLQEDVAVRRVEAALRARARGAPPPLRQEILIGQRLLLWLSLFIVLEEIVARAVGWWWSATSSADWPPPPPEYAALPTWLIGEVVPQIVILWLPLMPLTLNAVLAVGRAFAAAQLTATLCGMPVDRAGSPRPTRSPPLGPVGQAGSLGGSAYSLRGARRYWNATEQLELGVSEQKIGRRGPETLLSDHLPHQLPGTKFVRHVDNRLTAAQWRHLLTTTWRVLRGGGASAGIGHLRSSHYVLDALGATTVLACPGKLGILSDGSPSIKHVLFFRADRRGRSNLTTLDMSKHPSYRSLLRFDQPDWQVRLHDNDRTAHRSGEPASAPRGRRTSPR